MSLSYMGKMQCVQCTLSYVFQSIQLSTLCTLVPLYQLQAANPMPTGSVGVWSY